MKLGGCVGTVLLPRPPRGFRVAGHDLLLYGDCGALCGGKRREGGHGKAADNDSLLSLTGYRPT